MKTESLLPNCLFALLAISVAGFLPPNTHRRARMSAFQAAPIQKHSSSPETAWPSLFDETRDMVEVASLIYQFAELRNLHNKGKINICDTKLTAENVRDHPIEADDLDRLFSHHKASLRKLLGDEDFELMDEILDQQVVQEQKEGSNAALVVFDDSNNDEELVYGIAVNHSMKRVVVIFRGTVTTTDLITDAKVFQTKIPNPVKGNNQTPDIGIHSGFKEYLFGDDGTTKTKCNKIIKEVNDLLSEYPEYHLYVTGHSLGAALATLFAFHVASSDNVGIEGPVTCIPIASPKVGDLSFQTAVRSLEKKGLMRLVRVENDMDIVTVAPNPFMLRLFAFLTPERMYHHVGVSVKLFRDQHHSIVGSLVDHQPGEIPRHIRSHLFMLWQYTKVVFGNGADMLLDNHSCDEYLERLTKEKATLEPLALESLILNFD